MGPHEPPRFKVQCDHQEYDPTDKIWCKKIYFRECAQGDTHPTTPLCFLGEHYTVCFKDDACMTYRMYTSVFPGKRTPMFPEKKQCLCF